MEHSDLAASLHVLHPSPEWVFVTEVRVRAGWADYSERNQANAERIIDAFAMNTWPSRGHLRIAYEVKTSRSDWLRELRDQMKSVPAYYLSHRFYYVLAEGVWRPQDRSNPALRSAGIILVRQGNFERLRIATKRVAWPMPEGFVAMLLRRMQDVST